MELPVPRGDQPVNLVDMYRRQRPGRASGCHREPAQYPCPDRVAAMPTTGAANRRPPADPSNGASPKLKTPPLAATVQYPSPVGS